MCLSGGVFVPMLTEVFRDCDDGIHNKYRTGGKLHNLKRLQAVTKVKESKPCSTFSREVNIHTEARNRIAKAFVFGRL